MSAPRKNYFIDPTMANAIGFRITPDHGRLLENVVFLELKRRNFEVYYYRDKKECDFIASRPNQPLLAIQVCLSLEDEDTKQREVEGLLEALYANHLQSGYIITATESDQWVVNEGNESFAITVLPIWKWLLNS